MKKCGMRLRRLLGYYKGTSPGETSSSFLVLLLKYVRTYGRRGNTIPQVRLGTLRSVFQWLGPDIPGPRWELGTLHHHSYQVHTHVIPGIYIPGSPYVVRPFSVFLCFERMSCVHFLWTIGMLRRYVPQVRVGSHIKMIRESRQCIATPKPLVRLLSSVSTFAICGSLCPATYTSSSTT